jgi:hypothetical protein
LHTDPAYTISPSGKSDASLHLWAELPSQLSTASENRSDWSALDKKSADAFRVLARGYRSVRRNSGVEFCWPFDEQASIYMLAEIQVVSTKKPNRWIIGDG